MTRILSLFLLLITLAACTQQPSDRRPLLTATIEPVRYVVESIAGDRYQVRTLMPAGASPETYEPTPKQMMELEKSEALFRVGTLGYEQTRLPKYISAVPHLSVFDVGSEVLPLVDMTHHHEGEASIDPHVWMSPFCLNVMATSVCHALCRIDADHKKYYQQNLNRFCATHERLDDSLRVALRQARPRTFLIHHPALGYFARNYGLHQIAVEHDGKEPSAARIKLLVARAKADSIRTVFISKEYTGRAARRIAEQTGALVVSINPLDYNVPQQLRAITAALTSGK